MLAFVFDTETTGLIENRTLKLDRQPEIIEFYGCLTNLKTKKRKKEFNTFVKPKKPLHDGPASGGGKKSITDITGITNDMLADAPPFAKVSKTIFELITKAPLVIAHNASFDKDMIEIEAERLGETIVWPPVVCTVEQTIHLKGFRLSLSRLHEELFGEKFEGAHRAKIDVEALVRCCVVLYKRGIL